MANGSTSIWLGLLGLLPLVVYIVVVFRDWEPLPATALCVLIGAVLTHQSLISFGDVLAKAMGSFLALVGLIIMLGRGLGEVLTETKVAHTLVHGIIYGIGGLRRIPRREVHDQKWRHSGRVPNGVSSALRPHLRLDTDAPLDHVETGHPVSTLFSARMKPSRASHLRTRSSRQRRR